MITFYLLYNESQKIDLRSILLQAYYVEIDVL